MNNPLVYEYNAACRACLTIMLGAALVMLPDFAFAGTNTPMGYVLCTVVGWFTGNVGKGLATIAVTIIGIGALLGKVSWGMAIMTGVGVAIVFGAVGIVNAMGHVYAGTACTTSGSVPNVPFD